MRVRRVSVGLGCGRGSGCGCGCELGVWMRVRGKDAG